MGGFRVFSTPHVPFPRIAGTVVGRHAVSVASWNVWSQVEGFKFVGGLGPSLADCAHCRSGVDLNSTKSNAHFSFFEAKKILK